MFKITNLDQIDRELDAWLASVEAEITKVAKGLAVEALVTAAYESPQYSGDFTANWNLSVNQPDRSFTAGVFPEAAFPSKHPFINGDSPAIAYAMGQADGKLDNFKLGDTIWLCNSAVHQDDYAWKIENNRIKFRSGNSGSPLLHTMDYLKAKYGVITKQRAQGLMGVGL